MPNMPQLALVIISLVQIRNAWRRTTTGRAGKDFRKLLGIKGTIRALEVTHGQNGFHPHLHVLLLPGTGRHQRLHSGPVYADLAGRLHQGRTPAPVRCARLPGR